MIDFWLIYMVFAFNVRQMISIVEEHQDTSRISTEKWRGSNRIRYYPTVSMRIMNGLTSNLYQTESRFQLISNDTLIETTFWTFLTVTAWSIIRQSAFIFALNYKIRCVFQAGIKIIILSLSILLLLIWSMLFASLQKLNSSNRHTLMHMRSVLMMWNRENPHSSQRNPLFQIKINLYNLQIVLLFEDEVTSEVKCYR